MWIFHCHWLIDPTLGGKSDLGKTQERRWAGHSCHSSSLLHHYITLSPSWSVSIAIQPLNWVEEPSKPKAHLISAQLQDFNWLLHSNLLDLEINSEYLSGFSTNTLTILYRFMDSKKIGGFYSGPNFDIYCKILQLHLLHHLQLHPNSTSFSQCKKLCKYNSVQKLLHHFQHWWY